MRGVAIALVLAVHIGNILVPRMARYTRGGIVGVDVFFVLSGFLITTLLVNEHDSRDRLAMGRFYARRALRLLPALVALLAAHVIYTAVTHEDLRLEAKSVVVVLAYSANWWLDLGRPFTPALSHTWSLANEEQFYLLWPLALMFLLPRVDRGRVARLLVGMAAAVAVARAGLWATDVYRLRLVAATFGRFDGMLLGAALAFWWTTRASLFRVSRGWLVAGFAVLVAMLPLPDSTLALGGYTVASAAAALIIASLLTAGAPRVLADGTLPALGRISYALYLWHVPVFFAVRSHLDAPAPVRVAVGLGVSLAAAVLSLKLVERPFLRLKARFSVEAERQNLAPV